MSLDVELRGPEREEKCTCKECWNEHTKIVSDCFYSANITHNLGEMADAAGIYKALWRPDENGIEFARDLIEPLKRGLMWLTEYPDEAKKHNAENGWGTYKYFIPFVREYLAACEQYPDARVEVSR